MKAVDLEPIIDKIPKAAFGMFRFWLKESGIEKEIVIKTEQVLIDDLKHAFSEAIEALHEEENLEKKPSGHDVGFILGFASGNLRSHWHHEYITKNSEEYKSFICLRAIENYLQFDEVTRVRINKLYDHLMEDKTNIENLELTVSKSEFNTDNLSIEKGEEDGKVLALLNNQIIKSILEIAEKKDNVSLPVSDFFSKKDIKLLIARNKCLSTNDSKLKPS